MLIMTVKVPSIFEPVNQGFIIMAIVGFLLIVLAALTVAAPDLIKADSAQRPPLLRIPLVGLLLALIGVGSVPLLFLLGIYPFMIGMVGWSGNLWWYWQNGVYPTLPPESWIIKAAGVILARLFIAVVGHFKPLLKTHTIAEQLIPERLIGSRGTILSVLGKGLIEVNVYDNFGRFYVQIYGFAWENATDLDFKVGDNVYIVDLIAPRRYTFVKADSNDELEVITAYRRI
ncbi:hypothetical protein PCC8801_2460 [Rippkaea orientalis PCC 8801]|uniref:Uncharacterized protein n=2 Tax=Rippkaea TaxID=2546365 RepID=B7K3T0_RIPO1|nr:hypothetical protein PCC8801_2460 [Rippkaea orientalis PCC 8801]